MRRKHALATALTLLASLPSTALARQTVKLTAAFTPDRLNTPTTITFGFQISAAGHVPPALAEIDLRYPIDIGLATSGLGLATCQPIQLETDGPEGCPADSRMGHGSALTEIAIGPEILEEPASVTLLAGPPQDNHLDFLVYANGKTPVNGHIIFSALLLPETWPYGGRLHFTIPLVTTWPEGPDLAIVHLQTTIGPLGLTYYEHTHGKTHAYHPAGIQLPPTCPNKGFPFTANLTFQNGTHTHARTTVPCPQAIRLPKLHSR